MSSRFLTGARPLLPLCILCIALAGCGSGDSRPATLAQGDSVTIEAPYLGPGWHPATVGTLGECISLLVPSPPPPAQATRFDAVPFDSVTAARRGGASLSVAALRQAYAHCAPL